MIATGATKKSPLSVGAWTRPWTPYGLEAAVAHASAIGFRDFGLMTAGMRPDGKGSRYVIEPEDDAAHVARVGEIVRAGGLHLAILLTRARFKNTEEGIPFMRRSIDQARELGARFLLTGGTSRPEEFETFFATMAAVMGYAAESGVDVVMKPHGGLSATAADCVAVATRIDSPRFGICWDPGNVWHYTKTSPEEGFATVAPYVRVVCLKDYARPDVQPPGSAGPVRPGLGQVDWRYQFGVLCDHGFAGPCLIETLPGESIEQVDAAAADTKRHFEDLFASLAG